MPSVSDMARKLIISDGLKHFVDLNTDYGQSRDKDLFENPDESLLRYVSSVNIPCCVHDGDPREVMNAIAVARQHNCAVGAHIGLPDPANHGDQPMNISKEDLAAWIHVQMGTFQALCKTQNATIEHVRPHGALYASFVNDEETARVVAETLFSINPWINLIAPAGPTLEAVHEKVGVRVAPEVYLGKKYNNEGRLMLDRFDEDLSTQGVLDQVKQLLKEGTLTSYDGKKFPVEFHTFHISPRLTNGMTVVEKTMEILGQAVPLSVVAVGGSGWVLDA